MKRKHAKRLLRREARRQEAERCAGIAAAARIAGECPTYEEIIAARTGPGGWKRETLARWGVDWPPPKGWIEGLVRRREVVDAAARFLQHD